MDSKLFLHLFYMTSLIGLTSVAIWDVYNIITDFVNDNRVTSVKAVEMDFTYPFLTDPIICIYYNGSLFPGNPSRTEFNELLVQFLKNEEQLENITLNLLQIYVAHNIVKTVDDAGLDGVDFYADQLGINRSELSGYLDKFMFNYTNIEQSKNAWLEIRKWFISREDAPDEEISLYSIHRSSICFKPSLSKVLNPINRSITFGLDGYYVGNETKVLKYQKDRRGTGLFFPETEPVHTYADPKDVIFKSSLEIVIFNTALIDESRFEKCTPDFLIQADCMEEKKLETFGKVCHCIPFSLILKSDQRTKLKFQKNNTICTVSKYGQCWSEAQAVWEKEREDIFCRPCLTPKNRYAPLSLGMVDFKGKESDWKYNIFDIFKCEERNFLLFEEKPQFTVPQFISQIGGDLGLYIGFSMVGVLQLILYMCKFVGRKNVSGESVCGQWVKNLIQNGIDQDQKGGHGTRFEEAIKSLQERMDMQEKVLLEKLEKLEALIK